MGNYQSTETGPRFEPVTTSVEESSQPEQETKVYEPVMSYVVSTDNDFFFTDSLQKAKDYIESLISTDISVNYGNQIQVEEDEYTDMITYTLYRQDPTSLFCRYSFYCNYKILICKTLPEIVPLSSKKDD